MSDMENIYNIVNSVFRPDQIVREDDDELDTGDELDQEIDDAGADLDSGSDLGGDLGGDLDGDLGGDELGGDDLDAEGFGGDEFGSDEEEEEPAEEPEEPQPEPIGPQPGEDNLSDTQKVDQLYSDTGDISYDYGAGTEPNLRLSRFKFINAGIEPELYMDEEEMMTGVPSNVIEDRLSPEQKELYFDSNKKIREKYPKIAEREKNILIYNSGTPFVTYDLDNNEVQIEDPAQLKQAYKRIDDYLIKRYGVNWQDKRDAVEMLKNVKVNFDDKQKVQPNLIRSEDITPSDETEVSKIPFNKVSVETPPYIGEFIRSNIGNPEFQKSSIFSSLSSPYLTGEGKSDSPYAIIKGQVDEPGFEEPDAETEEPEADSEPDDEPEDIEGDEEVDEIEF